MNRKEAYLLINTLITIGIFALIIMVMKIPPSHLLKTPDGIALTIGVLFLGMFPSIHHFRKKHSGTGAGLGFTHGDENLDRQKAAIKWMMAWRYGWAMDHREYLLVKKGLDPNGEESTNMIMKVAEVIILCAAKDGLAENEKDWILGFFTCCNYNDKIINFISDYQPPEPSSPELDERLSKLTREVDEFYGNRATSIKRNIIFLAFLAADADGVISDDEYDKIKEIALAWDIKKEEVKTLQELVNRQFNLQIDRTKAVFPEVADKIPARRPSNHTGS